MNRATGAENFFETDASQENRERRAAKSANKNGNPLALKAKILAAIVDPSSPRSSIFVAEASGKVRRIDVESSSVSSSYDGPRAPVTSLAVDGRRNQTLYGGSWDKYIWSWDIASAVQIRRFAGHTDFVKALAWASIDDLDCIISGGADKKIIVWDANTGSRLHTIQDSAGSMLSIQHLAVDPVLSSATECTFVSASSDPHIRRWRVTRDTWAQLLNSHPEKTDAVAPVITEHETSVYKLFFENDAGDADLWTASADGTARRLSRARDFTTEDIFPHGDYLRAVVATESWVVTGGRDEDLKIWDKASGKLYCAIEGHFDEITDLVLLTDPRSSSQRVCSVSIDGTVRIWPLARRELDKLIEEIKKQPEAQAEEHSKGILTADEEAELEALMDEE